MSIPISQIKKEVVELYLSLCSIAITKYLSTRLACAVYRKQSFGAQKMAQQLRARTMFLEDLSSVPRTHVGKLTGH